MKYKEWLLNEISKVDKSKSKLLQYLVDGELRRDEVSSPIFKVWDKDMVEIDKTVAVNAVLSYIDNVVLNYSNITTKCTNMAIGCTVCVALDLLARFICVFIGNADINSLLDSLACVLIAVIAILNLYKADQDEKLLDLKELIATINTISTNVKNDNTASEEDK